MFKATLHRLRQKNDEEDGFTLVELLVVIVILGILAAVAVFAVAGLTDRGEEAACETTADSLQAASEAFRAERGTFADTIPILEDEGFLRIDEDISVTDDGLAIAFPNGTRVNYDPLNDGQVSDTCGAPAG